MRSVELNVRGYRGTSLIRNTPSVVPYSGPRGTSLIRNTPSVVPYSGPMPRDLWWSYGGGCFS